MRSLGRVSRIGASRALLACALLTAPVYGQVEEAGELFVSLDAEDATAGTDLWDNAGTLADFAKVGAPTLVEVLGAAGVEFNALGFTDAYQCQEIAPAGLVGEDPTRSIEAWVYNQDLAAEEAICAWSHRGGPCGTNMSFNYGSDVYFGAVGHWCHLPGPDIGWGKVPVAAQWHHLVYTYDGTTTRVYADGNLTNEEVVVPDLLDALVTHDGSPILLGAQYADATPTIDFAANVGTLVIGRLRVHDGVLTPEQIKNNHDFERPDFPVDPVPPAFGPDPVDEIYLAGEAIYSHQLTVTGFLPPTLEVLSPAGGTVDASNLFTYAIPAAEPASFVVRIKATNDAGTAETTWTVTKQDLPPAGVLAIAGELFVDLDAEDSSAGTDLWESRIDASLGPFEKRGNPILMEFDGSIGVLFNETARVGDSYVCTEPAPEGIVGPDPTRTIEVWVYNPVVDANEETILSFGRRGGGAGTNMSFNYAQNAAYGAVGHWDAPDLGWDRTGATAAPEAARWHHLVYTYDGTTTRLYSDGEEWNSEVVGAGVINTHAGTPIALAEQWLADGVGFENGIGGDLALARVRVHDGVLRPNQVKHNFDTEIEDFYANEAPVILDAPASDSVLTGTATYSRTITFRGYPEPTLEVLSPAGATISAAGLLSYTIPSPEPDSFDVAIRATSTAGVADATWTVAIVKPEKLASGPVHRYPFTLDATDEEGGADGTVYGPVVFANGQADFQNTAGPPTSNAVGLFPDPADPAKLPPGAYIDLPNGMISALGTQATFEAWFTWRGPILSAWQRIFDLGTSNAGEDSSADGAASSYVFLTPRSGSTTMRAGYRVGATAIERWVETAPATRNVETHVVLTWDDGTTTARLYVNGKRVSEDLQKHLTLAELPDVNNWLGRSQFNDAMYNGLMNEFRIYDRALSHEEVLGNFGAGPDVVNTEGGGGTQFRRGDANADGGLNITDGIFILNFLFLGGADPTCMDSADANDDGGINITDGIYVLNYLFLGGGAPPAPGSDTCGDDPSAEDPPVTCDAYGNC